MLPKPNYINWLLILILLTLNWVDCMSEISDYEYKQLHSKYSAISNDVRLSQMILDSYTDGCVTNCEYRQILWSIEHVGKKTSTSW